MDYNVLMLAMSTLPRTNLLNKTITSYRFKKDSMLGDELYEGIGQMEVVPIMLNRKLSQENPSSQLTHLLILETEKTRQPVEFNGNAQEAYHRLLEHYSEKLGCADQGNADSITHVDFFKSRMRHEGIYPHFEDIPIDDDEDPAPAFEILQSKIRDLYAGCVETGGRWRLWIDTHGAFREISMIMVGLMQMLSAPDEQDLAEYVDGTSPREGSTWKKAIAHLSDGKATIPIEAMFCSEFDPEKAHAKEPQPQIITDRTDFYKTFTKPAITAYMNYGQYAHTILRSDIRRDKDGKVLPFAFISYRSADATKERLTFIGILKKNGYRYWFDDAIRPQQDWAQALKVANAQSTVLIAFITKGYADSFQCAKELRQAIDGHKKIIFAALDKTSPYSLKEKPIDLRSPDNPNERVYISVEELSRILSKQQLVLKNLIGSDGALQEENLVHKLNGLRTDDEGFSAIWSGTHLANKAPRRGKMANCTNHPKATWSDAQLEAASAYGEVIDFPFPSVDPSLDSEGVRSILREYAGRVEEAGCDTALVAGEFSLTFMLIDKFLREGINVLCACSRRRTSEEVMPDGTVRKNSLFAFERFRPYEPYEPL